MKQSLNLVEFAPDSFLYQQVFSFTRIYGVTLNLSNGSEASKQVITFEGFIEMEKSLGTANAFRIIYKKSDVRINHRSENSIVMDLALKCSEAFYPLEMEFLPFANSLEILNQKEIQTRWQNIRRELDGYYKDKNSQWYLNKTEKMIANGFLAPLVQHDIFLTAFLGFSFPIQSRRKTPPIEFPIVPGRPPVRYALTQEISDEYTHYDTIVIKRKGKPDDKRTAYELQTGYNQFGETTPGFDLKGEIDLKYEIEKGNHMLQSIMGNVSLELSSDDRKVVDFTAYHMRERDKELIVEKKEENKEKGFLPFLKSLIS